MIVKVLEVFTEYVGIMLCVYRLARNRIKISWKNLLDIICYIVIAFAVENFRFGRLIIYVFLFLNIRFRITDTCKQTIKPFVMMMCAIPMMQLLLFAALGEVMTKIFSIYSVINIINVIIIVFFLIWKEEYIVFL